LFFELNRIEGLEKLFAYDVNVAPIKTKRTTYRIITNQFLFFIPYKRQSIGGILFFTRYSFAFEK
jgi:hypothetical protein